MATRVTNLQKHAQNVANLLDVYPHRHSHQKPMAIGQGSLHVESLQSDFEKQFSDNVIKFVTIRVTDGVRIWDGVRARVRVSIRVRVRDRGGIQHRLVLGFGFGLGLG